MQRIDNPPDNFFEGGNADLRLTDEENPLESGVEVMAVPPGKKISSNKQLSSGENALTAIALLFEPFQDAGGVKTVPFCSGKIYNGLALFLSTHLPEGSSVNNWLLSSGFNII